MRIVLCSNQCAIYYNQFSFVLKYKYSIYSFSVGIQYIYTQFIFILGNTYFIIGSPNWEQIALIFSCFYRLRVFMPCGLNKIGNKKPTRRISAFPSYRLGKNEKGEIGTVV